MATPESRQEGSHPLLAFPEARMGGQELTNPVSGLGPACLLKSLSAGESHSVHWPEWN